MNITHMSETCSSQDKLQRYQLCFRWISFCFIAGVTGTGVGYIYARFKRQSVVLYGFSSGLKISLITGGFFGKWFRVVVWARIRAVIFLDAFRDVSVSEIQQESGKLYDNHPKENSLFEALSLNDETLAWKFYLRIGYVMSNHCWMSRKLKTENIRA